MRLNKHGEVIATISGISLILGSTPSVLNSDTAIWYTNDSYVSLNVADSELSYDETALTDVQSWALDGLAAEFDLYTMDLESEECGTCEGCDCAEGNDTFTDSDTDTLTLSSDDELPEAFKNLTAAQILGLDSETKAAVLEALNV